MAQVHYVVKTPDLRSQIGRWSLQGGIDWHEWDDEVVVRLEPSGGTFLLSTLAGCIVIALRNGPAHVDEIAARVFDTEPGLSPSPSAALAARFSAQDPEAQRVLESLTELQAIGIVRSDLS